MINFKSTVLTILLFLTIFVVAQEKHHYQKDFTPEDFNKRRTQIFTTIGKEKESILCNVNRSNGKQIEFTTAIKRYKRDKRVDE